MGLSHADRLEIAELVARYNYAVDFGDVDVWMACFTEDGSFESGPRPSSSVQGAEALSAYAERVAARAGGMRHWTNNSVIEGDGDEATHRMYLAVFGVASKNEAPRLLITGSYDDRLVRSEGVWKFHQRRVTFDPHAAR
jgi:3-phenylpropionate/cinnamic acid dioxygenase small subunit